MALVPDNIIVDVPLENVKFVDVNIAIPALPFNVTVLDPRLIALTLLLLDDKEPAVTL